jgi:hypothetical protein
MISQEQVIHLVKRKNKLKHNAGRGNHTGRI